MTLLLFVSVDPSCQGPSPGGELLPVEVPLDAVVADLVAELKSAGHATGNVGIEYQGKLLHPSMALSDSGVSFQAQVTAVPSGVMMRLAQREDRKPSCGHAHCCPAGHYLSVSSSIAELVPSIFVDPGPPMYVTPDEECAGLLRVDAIEGSHEGRVRLFVTNPDGEGGFVSRGHKRDAISDYVFVQAEAKKAIAFRVEHVKNGVKYADSVTDNVLTVHGALNSDYCRTDLEKPRGRFRIMLHRDPVNYAVWEGGGRTASESSEGAIPKRSNRQKVQNCCIVC
eukprot:Hpha_TRINITY_DN15478_c3_g3::TRINITY_DN15478_c3_g3_i1::g.174222::m.174222